jgi:hypothetical protein
MNTQAAIAFVRANGDAVEQARLDYLLNDKPPDPAIVQQILAGQRADGGWSPFWTPDYSSIDATCFRLAQAEQSGITGKEPEVQRALEFLAQRQRDDGSWEEAEHVAQLAPPWAAPGDLAARLYLTANCGFWLAVLPEAHIHASHAADYLQQHLGNDGHLPTFLHAHWLAAGLEYRLRRQEAKRVFKYLERQLPVLATSNLAWLLSTLLLAGTSPSEFIIKQAASLLEQQQEQDGRWASEDGSERDVHVTLEALHVLRLCNRFARNIVSRFLIPFPCIESFSTEHPGIFGTSPESVRKQPDARRNRNALCMAFHKPGEELQYLLLLLDMG